MHAAITQTSSYVHTRVLPHIYDRVCVCVCVFFTFTVGPVGHLRARCACSETLPVSAILHEPVTPVSRVVTSCFFLNCFCVVFFP